MTLTGEIVRGGPKQPYPEQFASYFPPSASRSGQVSDSGHSYQIIGVVRNIKSRALGEKVRPVLFRSLAQDIPVESSFSGYSLLVSYRTNPSRVGS